MFRRTIVVRAHGSAPFDLSITVRVKPSQSVGLLSTVCSDSIKQPLLIAVVGVAESFHIVVYILYKFLRLDHQAVTKSPASSDCLATAKHSTTVQASWPDIMLLSQ